MSKRQIIYFTKYTEKGPSSRYRSYQYKSYLEEEFSLIFYPLFDDSYISNLYENKGRNYLGIFKAYVSRILKVLKCIGTKKIVFIEYELLPYFPPLLEFILYSTRVKVVLDYDDAIFHNYDRHSNFIVRSILKNKIRKLAKSASLIITGSPYLTSYFLLYNEKVIEIPTSINFHKYNKISQSNTLSDSVVVGWIGSKSTSENILFIKEFFHKAQLLYPNVLFKLMGFDSALKSQLNLSNVEFHHWSESSELIFLSSIDLGIMPLVDTPFNRGKCGFKLIQYMAMGKPTISSPLEANVKINRSSKNLFASTIEEWISCLENYMCKIDYYREVGVKNRDIVKQFYSVEANSSLYIESFKKIYNVWN